MTLSPCKWCGQPVKRGGSKVGVFCSLDCKGAWQRTQKPVDKAWLEQKYLVEKFSSYQIAKLVNRNPRQVYEWLKGYGIPTRARGKASAKILATSARRSWKTQRDPTTRPYHDPAWLREEYVVKQRPASAIAAEYGVTEANILYFLRLFEIPRRDMKEIRTIKHWGLSGTRNGMFGKIGVKSPNWKGGMTPFRQQVYSSSEWQAFARKIKRRDKVCRLCGSSGRCHIHHIEPVSKAPLLIMDEYNVILLCIDCHHKVTRRERWWRKRLYALVLQKAS